MNTAAKQTVGLVNLDTGSPANAEASAEWSWSRPVTQGVANPFASIADRFPDDACVIAQAFAVSHNGMDDVHAALRMHRKSGGSDMFGYLMGRHFLGWYLPGYDREIDPVLVPELREMAHRFLDGGV